MTHIVVLGQMGVGKTSTGQALAERLGRPFSDSDRELEKLTGRTGGDIAAELGVVALHQLERGLLIAALARTTPHIIAAAASTIEDPTVRELLESAIVVYVHADIDTIHARQTSADHRRHMMRDELQKLADRRLPFFAEVEDIRVDGTSPVSTSVDEVMALMKLWRR